MYTSFTDFLNSTFGGGTMIVILIGLISACGAAGVWIVKAYKSIKKMLDTIVERRVSERVDEINEISEKDKLDKETKERNENFENSINDLKTEIRTLTTSMEIFQKEFNAMVEQESKINKKSDRDIKKLEEIVLEISDKVSSLQEETELLKESDKDSIKAFITKEYNYWVPKGCIDIYSLKAIESRYAKYVKEHGNSFVEDLMIGLRGLDIIIPSTYRHEETENFDNKLDPKKVIRVTSTTGNPFNLSSEEQEKFKEIYRQHKLQSLNAE